MDLLERIELHLRQFAPHQVHAGMILLAEARDEILRQRKLATCECGDKMMSEIERLRIVFRVNIIRIAPKTSHAEIDRILNGEAEKT